MNLRLLIGPKVSIISLNALRTSEINTVAMEGFNGFARPLDGLVQEHNYHHLNINNLKLARFKEIFPAAAKLDRIDAGRGLELMQL